MIPTISNECSQFLTDCKDRFIVKNLPSTYQGFTKVKVRFGKTKTQFSESFNFAFKDNKHKLHRSAIFGYTEKELLPVIENEEPFYIFPINGYKMIYNPQIKNSHQDFSKLNLRGDLISELLKMSYKNGNLNEALNSRCEIILYNIPYYYAIRSSILDDCGNIIL